MKAHDVVSAINTMVRAFGTEALVIDVIAEGGLETARNLLRERQEIIPLGVMPKNIWEMRVRQERLAELNRAIREYSLAGIIPDREWVLEAEYLREYLDSRVG